MRAALSRQTMTVADAVTELGILIVISIITSQNNKDEMVVLSNHKQGGFNYNNEWQDLSDRWRGSQWEMEVVNRTC